MSVRRLTLLVGFSSLVFASSAIADVQKGLDALDAGNVAAAAAEFQSAFEAGDGDGAFYLARLFEFGLGADKDMNRAANLYAAGAQAGSVNSMNRLGMMYLQGTTLLKNYSLARSNFCKAADAGDQNGQLNCALMAKEGRGGDVDAMRAADLFGKAGDQGNIAAKNILAAMYLNGDGIDANEDAAIKLFSETADAGNAMGLFELAKFHGTAVEGRPADVVKAYAFANLAGVRNLKAALEYRDALEADMTQEQVSEAQRMSQDWTATRIAQQANQN